MQRDAARVPLEVDSDELALTPAEERFERLRQRWGLILAPLGFLLVMAVPLPSLSPGAHRLGAVFALVFVLWVTEGLPLPVTAVLGPTLCVVMGIGAAQDVFAPFADPLIFLFFGGFILANAIFVHGLDQRLAYTILSLPKVASHPGWLLFSFGGICFFVSMWLSNTATAAMMFPIGLAIFSFLRSHQPIDARYGTALMLVTAYGSSLGGLSTPVGSPPNLIAMGMLKEFVAYPISFFEWMVLAFPVAAFCYVVIFFYLHKKCPSGTKELSGSGDFLRAEKQKLGPMRRGEKNVLLAFLLTVTLWIGPGLVALVAGSDNSVYLQLTRIFPEAISALLGATLLFVLPLDWKARRFTLTWKQAVQIDWGTILLFGGGLALGKLAFSTGLAEYLGKSLLYFSPWEGSDSLIQLAVITLLSALLSVVLSEMVSNTAAANMTIPVVLAVAASLQLPPAAPGLAAGLAASLGFMLPVSTPPNAIVFSSGLIPVRRMIRFGVVLDLLGLAVVTAAILLYFRILGGG